MYQRIFELQAKILKALAHSRRLEIIQLLQNQEMSVTDIYQMLDLPQANVSQHLMILKEMGILEKRKQGKQIYYRVAASVFFNALDCLREFLIDKHKDTNLADEFTISMHELVPVTHDPVCQMRVSPRTAGFAAKHKNKDYYFCASGCHKKFVAKPEIYVTN